MSNQAVGLLLMLWGAGTLAAFWQLEAQYLRPVPRPAGAVLAQPDRLPMSPVATLTTDRGDIALNHLGPITLLNFWNPACSCSRYMEGPVRRLAREYGPRGVRLITVVECGALESERADALAAWRGRGLSAFAVAADPGGGIARRFGVWAAPAAVILNRRGRVAYVGAYNAARYCDNRETAWAAQALAAIVADRTPPRTTSAFYGCQVLSRTY